VKVQDAIWASSDPRRSDDYRSKIWASLAEDMVGLGYWYLDVATMASTWSEGLFRFHGLHVGEAPDIGTARSTVHPADRARADELLTLAIERGQNYSHRLRVKHADGTWHAVLCRAVCERDKFGVTVGVIGTILDISEIERTDEALRASEAQYRLLAENATDIIVRADLKGNLLYVSPSCRALGYEPAELIGVSSMSLVHPDDLPSFIANTTDLVNDRKSRAGSNREHRYRTKTGVWVWLQGNPTVVRDLAGTVVEIINVFRDVTERRKLDSALAQALEAADKAASVKSTFLANMSHELRTPLTSILGYAELLLQQPDLNPKSHKFVDRLYQASQALLTTVNDILDFSKLEAGQIEFNPIIISPTETCRSVMDLFLPRADNARISLRLEVGEGVPGEILIDGQRLRQILLNLIGNAVKFTAVGHVTVGIEYSPAVSRLKYTVSDTGPGIPVEQLGRLFKRFSQVEGASGQSLAGTGLGLAICKGLVEAMGGQVGVVSTLGAGSTFWFEIPANVCRSFNSSAA
jgi:PAS domain S-box-containing protein